MDATSRLPERAQVVIVGGGVIGCSIAYHLTRLGCTDVVLLERHELTAGTTWHAAGLITSAGMLDETSLFMARYSRDLYSRLEAETGHSTGFRPVGHVMIASTPARLEALRRASAWFNGFGVDDREISPREVAELWPLLRTDDVLAGFHVADEGRADPVGVAVSLAKGARQRGVRVIEHVSVTGVEVHDGRVVAVRTDAGRIECEHVVNAAGMWARQFGALAGVQVPLQAAEHYYLLTGPVPGMHPDLPVVEDPERYGYYRPEGDGMLVGLFEPVAAAWSPEAVPDGFSFGTLEPDWDRLSPFLSRAMDRVPSLADCGVRMFFCGPESFTPDLHPMLGPAPELDGYWVAAGLNSLGILLGGGVGNVLAQWIVDGAPPVDITGYAVDRAAGHESSRRFRRQRTVEQLGALFGDAAWPAWKPRTARGVRRSVLHDRHVAAGAHFGVSCGWEFPEWFAGAAPKPVPVMDFVRQPSSPLVAAEHRAVREAVGVMDMSLMAKWSVQGPDAATVLSRLSANHVDREVGRVVYTQWLDERGGIAADVTVTRQATDRFCVVASDLVHRRVEAMVRRATHPGEHVTTTDITAAITLLSVQGPRSRDLLQGLAECDLSNEALPYLTGCSTHVGAAPLWISRVTYVGELGYELHVSTDYAVSLYDDLLDAGVAFGLRPVGLAAMAGLRLEKGYRDMGVDIDNTDTPLSAGLGFAVAWDKPGGFIGRDALLRQRNAGPTPDRVVGVFVDDPDADLFGGESVFADGRWVGYVRAAAFGHTLGGPVGLAQVSNPAGVTEHWLASTRFTVGRRGNERAATLQVAPLLDPRRERILAR